VMNLMINAAEASDRAGRVRFTVNRLEGGVTLSVEDNGSGIAPSLHEKVMGAFFTTKETGSGLGLTSVRSCVDIHAGTMSIGDSELGGAKFSIWLPDLSPARIEVLRNPESAATVRTQHRVSTPDYLQL
jgi:signal transduction histidine kinase